jgi:hypothetical protein
MKFTTDRPFADAEKAARRLMQHAHACEVVQDGRIYIEKINGPFLYVDWGTPEEYAAGLALAIERGWLTMHESGTLSASRKAVRIYLRRDGMTAREWGSQFEQHWNLDRGAIRNERLKETTPVRGWLAPEPSASLLRPSQNAQQSYRQTCQLWCDNLT